MRHRKAGRKLGRNTGQRRALYRTMITQLFLHERIQTTEAKAKAIRGRAERLITLAKRGNNAEDPARRVHARRLAAARLNGPEVVRKLFDEIAPRYAERPGGYTRILKLGQRQGDGARMALIELVEE
ncbi:MAG: 50S ribosomal protein L17 [Anaerolineae bacterium]|nr:50S ribosomal protein L17 [Anaerolineae bacterium]